MGKSVLSDRILEEIVQWYWQKYYCVEANCVLCNNSGVIKLSLSAKSHFCFCMNGRTARKLDQAKYGSS